jgi:hypothetical protein
MRLRISPFTDVDEVKKRIVLRFGQDNLQVHALLTFVDDARERIARMQSTNASIHLRKEFKVGTKRVSVVAGTVHGLLPTLWARMTA